MLFAKPNVAGNAVFWVVERNARGDWQSQFMMSRTPKSSSVRSCRAPTWTTGGSIARCRRAATAPASNVRFGNALGREVLARFCASLQL